VTQPRASLWPVLLALRPQWSLIYPLMIDKLRTLLAKSIVRHLNRPRPLAGRVWLWLAAEADNLEEKCRCLIEVLRLDPENEEATLALLVLDQRRPTN